MKSILSIIKELRQGGSITLNSKNSNRYRVVVWEKDGSQTAYYFSSPVYENESRRLVTPEFAPARSGFVFRGSNSLVQANNGTVCLSSQNGGAIINVGAAHYDLRDGALFSENTDIYPALNGVEIDRRVSDGDSFTIAVHADKPYMNIRANNKSFALMQEEFRPYLTASSIGAFGKDGNCQDPAALSYQKIDDSNYTVTLTLPENMRDGTLSLECNMYEEKLFQDTTVESKNPIDNNAFGGMAYIGATDRFGEQWLYSRLEHNKVSDVADMYINKAVLHLPHCHSGAELCASGVSQRFCSFGSNWQNKIAQDNQLVSAVVRNQYYSVPVTDWFVNPQMHTLNSSDGIILRPKNNNGGFAAVATGDSYCAPQVLEINFR